jgi:hypothetical protein
LSKYIIALIAARPAVAFARSRSPKTSRLRDPVDRDH